jgi:hypothetical protein
MGAAGRPGQCTEAGPRAHLVGDAGNCGRGVGNCGRGVASGEQIDRIDPPRGSFDRHLPGSSAVGERNRGTTSSESNFRRGIGHFVRPSRPRGSGDQTRGLAQESKRASRAGSPAVVAELRSLRSGWASAPPPSHRRPGRRSPRPCAGRSWVADRQRGLRSRPSRPSPRRPAWPPGGRAARGWR